MNEFNHFAGALFTRLVWTSIQAVVLIAIVLLIVRLLPRLPAAVRCTLWWLLSLQLVLGLCWHAPLTLPLLGPVAVVTSNSSVEHASIAITGGAAMPVATSNTSVPHHEASLADNAANGFVHWREWLPTLWLAAMLVQLPLLARQWWRTRRLLRAAKPLVDVPMQKLCAQRARAFGLRRCPPLYVSADIDSPQISGLRQPVVLLPATHAMTPAESALAIAHELAHLRRGDLWLGWLPAIARRLFFFHPLVRWALREYAFEREAACDAEVLQQTGALPHAYAQLLLRLGVSHPIHAGLAGASPTFHNLKRRLIMLQHVDPDSRRHLRGWLLVGLVAAAGVLPYRVTAASSQHNNAAPPAANVAATVPMPPMAPLPPPPPMNTLPPSPPPPLPPPPPGDAGFSAQQVNIDTMNHGQSAFALFDGNSTIINGSNAVFDGDSMISINGSKADLAAIRKLHAANKSMLWFRRGGHAYLIRDKAMLERAERIYAPVTALARQQGRLAGQQGTVAGRQAGLAAQDAAFAQQQAELAGQQAEWSARIATHEAAGSNQQAYRSELDAQRREMDATRAELDKRHADLEARVATQRQALETQQAGFEKQQHALDRQQQQAQQHVEQAMSQLLDEALAKGLAQKTSLR